VVVAHHGKGGNVKTLKGICMYLFGPAGYACVTVHPLETGSSSGGYMDLVLEHMIANSGKYNIDEYSFFIYGYSRGGHSVLYYMMFSEEDNRNRVKGVISDCSSPGDDAFNWKKKRDNKFIIYPPYFMVHCAVDEVMKPKWCVDKSVKNIKKANDKRGKGDYYIDSHYMKFTSATGCNHMSLVQNSEPGKAAALSFLGKIMSGTTGDAVFDGIPAKVETAGCVLGQPVWKAPAPAPGPSLDPSSVTWTLVKQAARCAGTGVVVGSEEECQEQTATGGFTYYSYRAYDFKCVKTVDCDMSDEQYWSIKKVTVASAD